MSEDKVGKKKAGRRSPSFPINEAVGFLQTIVKQIGEGPFNREAIGKALGHATVTGSVTTKIGSLTHFGLLEIQNGAVYRISALGKRLIYPRTDHERHEALAESAKQPTLYAELLSAFTGKSVPPLLPNILIQTYGVSADNAESAAATFRQTMEFVGLLRNGILHPTVSDTSIVGVLKDALAQQPSREAGFNAQPSDLTPKDPPPLPKGEVQEFTIPLSRRRTGTLRLPLPLDETDVVRIGKWLELMKDVLTADSSELEP